MDDDHAPEENLGRGLPRPVEALAAGLLLAAAAPFLALAALLVVTTSPGPALFRQERVGRRGQRFRLLKLRSMTAGNEGPRVTAGGDRRVTPVGRFLRRTKVDELPSLWNVLVGEMSLVGPRPEVPEYVDLDDPLWRRLLAVRPGLTDPVTLRLRDEESLLADVPEDERLNFYTDVLLPYKLNASLDYLRRRNARSDLGVLLRTLAAVAFRSSPEAVILPPP